MINNFVSTIAIEKKLDSLYELEHFDIELPIPWKNDARTLPDKKNITESRLRNIMKLLRKSNLFDRYDVEIKKLLHNGYTESIPPDAIIHKTGVYLPHHPVTKNAEKLHVVFDCASQCQGASLNSACLQGPTLPNK